MEDSNNFDEDGLEYPNSNIDIQKVIKERLSKSTRTTAAKERQNVINTGRHMLNRHSIFVSSEILKQTNVEQNHNHVHRSWVVGIVSFLVFVTLIIFAIFILYGVHFGYVVSVFTLIISEGFAMYKIIAQFYFSNYLTENYEFIQTLLQTINDSQNTFDKEEGQDWEN